MKSRRLDTAVNCPDKLYLSHKDYTHGDRIIFPFFDAYGKIPFFQSRAFGGTDNEIMENVRYLSKVGAEKSVFNLDKVRGDIGDIFVFEGPIDACFVRNGVAVAGVSKGDSKDLTNLQKQQLSAFTLTHRIVWCLDNQHKDETSREKTDKLLQQGECVFIWPEDVDYKDFNEWCISEGKDEIPIEVIQKNVKCGLVESIEVKTHLAVNTKCVKENDPLDDFDLSL